MRIYFIRHAQSTNNHLWMRQLSSVERSDDPFLSALGEKQADILAAFLKNADQEFDPDWRETGRTGFRITHVYCSLMVRAVQTGTAVATALNVPLIGGMDLHECGGIYLHNKETEERIGCPGKNRAYFEEHFPHLQLPDVLNEEGWWNRPYEQRDERLPRAKRVLNALLDKHQGGDDHLVVVTHGAFYNHLLTVLLNLPEDHPYWFALNNVGMTCIDFWEEGVGIRYMNRTISFRVSC